MTRIDGLIILDSNGKPLITSNFPSHPPSYPSIHIDAYNHARKSTLLSTGEDATDEVSPVLWVNSLAAAGTSGSAGGGAGLCHLEREGLRFLVPIGQEGKYQAFHQLTAVNPLFAFSFLESFLETLREYLGDVTETTLKDNFEIVYMLIEEMLDEGHPMTTETNMLKEIVLPPTLMRKLLSAAGVSGLQAPGTAPFTAPIPWRSNNVRHNTNEIYFDIEESLDAILDRRGNVLSSQIWGRINCNSRLSGTPDLSMSFNTPKAVSNCSFHPCIRYKKWERDGLLSFIPPDGKFRLMEYQAEGARGQGVPVGLKANMTVEEYGGKFSLTLSSRSNHRPVEDIEISIHLGRGATSVSATASGDKRPSHAPSGGAGRPGGTLSGRSNDAAVDGPMGGVGGGNWSFDPHTQILRWSLASLVSNERPPSLIGSFVTSDQHPTPSPAFSIAYRIQNFTYSNLNVDQLKVHGDVAYKPFKGVRTMSRAGKVEVRW